MQVKEGTRLKACKLASKALLIKPAASGLISNDQVSFNVIQSMKGLNHCFNGQNIE